MDVNSLLCTGESPCRVFRLLLVTVVPVLFIISASAMSVSSSLQADRDAVNGTKRKEVSHHLTATLVDKKVEDSKSLAGGTTSRVSVALNGTQGSNDSGFPSVSADGRYVAFTSYAGNLVNGDTNGVGDVFVHDRQTGQTTRVSVASDGTQGNDSSGRLSISANGRYVAFASLATNLVSGDTNGAMDTFVYDRQTGQTTRVSGQLQTGTQGNDDSGFPSISADGRYIAFWSYASNLVSGDTNGVMDVFVNDRQTGQTIEFPSLQMERKEMIRGRMISFTDGRYVGFSSGYNLVNGDTNGTWDAFMHDRKTGQTTRISVASNGIQGNDKSSTTHLFLRMAVT